MRLAATCVGLTLAVLIAVLLIKGVDLPTRALAPRPLATRPDVRVTTRPSLALRPKPKKVVEMPMIVSPANCASSPDARIAGLIEAHNAAQDRIASAVLHGGCSWAMDGPFSTPRPMSIDYLRASEKASITCGPQACSVEAGKVTMAADSPMNLDSLYLIAFRKYDGRGFHMSSEGAEEGRVVAVSESEKLTFDAESGRLTETQVSSAGGPLLLQFGEPVELSGAGTAPGPATFPSTITIHVPKGFIPFKVENDGQIKFTLNAAKSSLLTGP